MLSILLCQNVVPGHVYANTVECDVVHEVVDIGGIHLIVFVHVCGSDLFLADFDGIPHRSIGDVQHGVEHICRIQTAAAVNIAFVQTVRFGGGDTQLGGSGGCFGSRFGGDFTKLLLQLHHLH